MPRRPRSQRRSANVRQLRPPLRRGINATALTLPEEPWLNLGSFLRHRFGAAAERTAAGNVFYDFAQPADPTDPYQAGKRIWIFRPVPDEPAEPILLPVVARGDGYLIIDKPHGLASIPRGSYVAKSVTVAARRQFSNDAVVPAHRLDALTAGLMLLTTRVDVRGAYQRMFDERRVEKRYLAVAGGIDLAERAGTPDSAGWHRLSLRMERVGLGSEVVPGEPNSLTYIRQLRQLAGRRALYELRPVTGRTHQLRVALNYLGAPILGDPLYPRILGRENFGNDGVVGRRLEMDGSAPPLQLLASELAFTDPYTGEPQHFRSSRTLELRG